MRVAFYAVDGLGLGHVTRLVSIARAVRRLEPAVEVLFLTSSEADSVVFREGFAAVKVPSKTIREEVGLTKHRYLKLVQTVIWNALAAFEPDVLVVDTYPTGSFEELIPVLRWRQRNIFVFREQRAEAAAAPLMQATLPLYDAIIVPHDDASAVGAVPEPHKLRAVGPILVREREELLSPADARHRLGLGPDEQAVYASFGGGGDPEARGALECTAAALAGLAEPVRLFVGQGPLYRGASASPSPGFPGAVVLSGVYPMLEVLPAFDAAVTAAGYNTVHELLFAGVPAVLVPFERVLDDQERRAHAVERAGAGRLVAPLTRAALAAALREVLEPSRRRAMAKAARALVPHNGAQRAARVILERR
jgi:UDP:flavonoid glycosyltransferase YjiC (YdhE family)